MFDLIEKSGKRVAKNVAQTAIQKAIVKISRTTGYKLAKTLAVETSEEIAAELANNVLDSFVMGDKSQYNQYVKYLKNNAGYSDADARKAATNQFYGKKYYMGRNRRLCIGIMGGTGYTGRYRQTAEQRQKSRRAANSRHRRHPAGIPSALSGAAPTREPVPVPEHRPLQHRQLPPQQRSLFLLLRTVMSLHRERRQT